MKLTNKEIIEKSTMVLADLASGGLMNEQQSSTFLRMIQDQPTLLKQARFIPMQSDSMKIEKIGFGNRILRAGVENTPLTEDQKAKPTTSKIHLQTQEVIAEVNISYDTLENNIEGDGLYNTIMSMIAERASLDLEELGVKGDKSNASDPYLALIDGYMKKATSHVVNIADATLDKNVFKKGIKALPQKYFRNPAEFRFFTSQFAALDWKDIVASRQTALGDTNLQGGNATAYGVPVESLAMLQPYTSNAKQVSDMLFTHPKNLVYGMNRNIRIEVDKDIRARSFIIVLTAKIDVQFEEEDAVVKITKVGEIA
jgi:HK97 family phage major capsid protein